MSDTDTDADASSSSSPLYTPTSSLYSSFTTHDIPPSPRISLDASRPDSPGSDDPWGSSSETDSTDSDAEEEWRESLRQLEMFAGLVLMPLVGKFLGRRCAYWGESLLESPGGGRCGLTSGRQCGRGL